MTIKLLTPAQLAEILEVTEPVVMEWRRTYNWPHVRIGRKIRFSPTDVEQIITLHSVQPKKDAVDAVAAKPATIAGQTARSARRSA